MKILTFFAFIFLFQCSYIFAAVESYYSIGFGAGGKADAPNLSFDIGFMLYSTSNNIHMLGILSGMILNSEDIPSNARQENVAHNNYVVLDTKQKGAESFVALRYSARVLENKSLSFSLFAGVSGSSEVEIVQSTGTIDDGWVYQQPHKNHYYLLSGAGVAWFFDSRPLFLSTDFDYRRGATFSVGLYVD